MTPRIITEDGLVQVNGLFGNLKIGNTKNTLHYRYYDGTGVFFDATGNYGKTGLDEFRNLIMQIGTILQMLLTKSIIFTLLEKVLH